MPPLEPPADISVRVKVPPGYIDYSSIDEFTVGHISASMRIGELRDLIQKVLPSHPNPERQRLLYAGRALVDNEQTLASALNTRRDTSQVEYVIHLLVKDDQSGQGAPSRRNVSSTGSGSGLPSVGPPQEQGNTARVTPQPGGQPAQGLPQWPHISPQPPAQFNQAAQLQHLAFLQQRQAQIQRMQQLGPHQHPGMPPMLGGRPAAGIPPANGQNPTPLAPGQLPQRQGTQPGNQNGSEEPAAGSEGAHQDGTADHGTSQSQANNTEAQQPRQPHGPHRPISGQGFHVQGVGPGGNRFEIHQQTLNIPFPGQQPPPGVPMPQMPGMGLPFPLPGMAQQRPTNPAPQPGAPSALDRARQNVAEMRQMVDAMRTNNATEEDRARTARLQEHIQAVNDYIDPFGVGRPNPTSRSVSPFPQRMAQSMRASPSLGLGPFVPPPRAQPQPTVIPGINNIRQQSLSNSDVTCYLLSSPQGPQALLFSPQHGRYTGSLEGQPTAGPSLSSAHRVTQLMGAPGQPASASARPAGAAQGQNNQQGNVPAVDPAVAAAQQVAQQINQAQQAQAQARPAAQDNPLGPMQPILAHFWLLLRVLIFAYFILGTNMGWRRPVALATLGLGFYLIRAGLFGEGGIARRWWDGIVRVEQRPLQQQQVQGEGVAANGEQRPGQLPTPEELAERLVRERQEALNRAPVHRLREHLRPVERAAALFFASFWPGVGEAHVRAREAEERRRAEEEVEQRRREEEERQRAIEAEKGGDEEKQPNPEEDSSAAKEAAGAGHDGEKKSEGSVDADSNAAEVDVESVSRYEAAAEDEPTTSGEKASLDSTE